MSDVLERIGGQLIAAEHALHAAAVSPARRMRFAWLRRRSRPLVVLAVLLTAGGSAAAAVSLLGRPSAPLSGTVPTVTAPAGRAPSLAVVPEAGGHYRVTVAPTLDGGTAGWASFITVTASGRHPNGGGISGGYPTRAAPVFEYTVNSIGANTRSLRGDIVNYVLTGPEVAAVRVGETTIATATNPRLPSGDRIAVFFVPANSPLVVAPPPGAHLPYYERIPVFAPFPKPRKVHIGTGSHARVIVVPVPPSKVRYRLVRTTAILPLDRRGHVIPTTQLPAWTDEPSRWWQKPTHPPTGPCQLAAHGLPGLTPEWGHVATAIVPVTGAEGELFLSCTDTEYDLERWPLDAAILLDARHPGRTLAQIPGATPVKGQPGTVNLQVGNPPGDITARRVGNAWIAVQGGRDERQRLQVLNSVNIAKLTLPRT
jgi:hypothetical protein